jgi:biopolymer transport protein ExbD
LTATIDTVFNLLIFFAVTTTFVGARTGLPMRLPAAHTAQPVPERVTVALMPGQPLQVNGQPVAATEVGRAVARAAGGNHDAQVVVMADARVPYAELVAALDQVRLADFHRIALAAQRASTRRSALPGAAQ